MVSLAFLTGSNAISCLAGKTTEINESAHWHLTEPLAIASMIALQVVRTSFGFHLRASPPWLKSFYLNGHNLGPNFRTTCLRL